MLAIRFTLLLTIALVTGCATPSVLQQARTEYAGGEPFKALKTLEAADVAKRDSLLLLLDRGAIAFSAGQYAIAQRTLLDAHKLIEEWDQIRVSDQSASLVTNEWATRYRGEYSERLWINSYLMMVFLMQNNPESAAVEARRALKRLNANKKPLKIDWFTRALVALSFEAAGAHDSAQVEYRKLSEDKGYDGRWNHAIERHTRRIGRKSFITKASDSFTRSTPKKLARDEGELILFLQSGSISPKLPGGLAIDIELNIAFPYYEEFEQSEPYYEVVVDGESVPFDRIDTHLVDVSKRSLAARSKTIATKQVARIAAKKALADAAAKEDELLGGLVQLVMFATEQADTRSWETLPGWFSLVRIPLPTGEQNVVINIIHGSEDHKVDLGTINIEPGGMHFTTFRTNQPLPVRDGQPLDAMLETIPVPQS